MRPTAETTTGRWAVVLLVSVLVLAGPALAKGGPPDHARASGGDDGEGHQGPGDSKARGPPAHANDESAEPASSNAEAGSDGSTDADDDGPNEPARDDSTDEADAGSNEGSTEDGPDDERPSGTDDSSDRTEDDSEDSTTRSDTETTGSDGSTGETGEADAGSEAGSTASESQTTTDTDDSTRVGAEETDGAKATEPSTDARATEDSTDATSTTQTAATEGGQATEDDPQPAGDGESSPSARDGAERSPARSPSPAASPTEPLAGGAPRDAGPVSESGSSVASTADPQPGWLVPTTVFGALAAIGAVLHARRQPVPRPAPEPASNSKQAEDPDSPEVEPPLGGSGIERLLVLGSRALDEGDLETALTWFDTAAEADPDLQTAHFCRGLCLDELGRLEDAAESLETACQLESGGFLAAYAHASVLARIGDTEAALRKLERLVNHQPEVVDRLREDEDLTVLGDHPRFLALTGEL